MNFFVSGGAGFIGGHLCESLLADGHTVYAMDNFSTGSPKNIEKILNHPAFHFEEADIISSDKLQEFIEKSDVIFHLAAVVGVELVVRDPVGTILTNVNGSERILSLASQFGKRIFLASTSEVYGKSDKLPFSETDDLVIGPSTHSRWSYACSKLLDEFLLMAYHRNKNLNGTVVRFFNTVGPRQTGEYGMVIPRFVKAARQGEPLKVYGTGKQTRCFCHVYDTVRALKLLVAQENIAGRVFNIGSTRSISMEELAELTIHTLDSGSRMDRISYDQAYESGFEDMLHRRPDISAIHKLTGWTAEIPLEQIIRDVAESQEKA
ncbi:MAG: GDP-mannose 4,6-dehydratase [Lentisphaeria bacterium]|nr:GDP-mannose 4,6-dehydratase [Lentisphaeria bacterium]